MAAPWPEAIPGAGALPWRAYLAGFLAPATLAVQALAVLAPLVPETPQGLAVIARMTESLGPQILVASLVPALLLAGLAHRRTAALLALLALAGLVWTGADYARMRAPAGARSDLTLLWFNLFFANRTPREELVAAIAGSGADVVMLAEAAPVARHLDALERRYPYRLGCDAVATCSVMILSRRPFERAEILGFDQLGESRLLHVRLAAPAGGRPVDLLAVHLLKPWYLGLTGNERTRLDWILRRYKGPLVMAGDFNAAPWSRRMRRLHATADLGFARWPVATWPAAAGAAGIPIDHLLVRGGAGIVATAPWGGDLGSNHRGLLARLDLGPAPAEPGPAAAP